MSDPFSLDSKVEEIKALFSTVGFSFDNFSHESFTKACEQLGQKEGVVVNVRHEPPVTRAKLTTEDGTNYQILYDGALHVS